MGAIQSRSQRKGETCPVVARTGPAVQDIWMLLSGDRGQRQKQLGPLMDGYEMFREFNRDELALIEPLRTLRLIHYSAWLARRS